MKKQKLNFGIPLLVALLLLGLLLTCQSVLQHDGETSPLYSVCIDNKWGCIDSFGKIVIKPQYPNEVAYFKDRLLLRDDTSAFIADLNGKKIIRIPEGAERDIDDDWLMINDFSDSIRFYNLDNKKQLSIARRGITNAHADFKASNRALIIFDSNKGYGYLNKSGKMVFTVTKGFAHPFDGDTDLAAVEFENQTCYIDTMGKTKFCVTGKGEQFVNGYAIVRSGNTKYFINRFGKKILDVSQYDYYVSPIIDGISLVFSEEKGNRLINLKGEDILPAKYHDLDYPVRGVLPAKINVGGKSKYVLINLRGEKVLDQEYDDMHFAGDGNLIKVRLGEKTGLINHRGQFVWVDPPRN
jgi:WG containing repeat